MRATREDPERVHVRQRALEGAALIAVLVAWWLPPNVVREWAPLPDALIVLVAAASAGLGLLPRLVRPGLVALALVLLASHVAADDTRASFGEAASWARLVLAFAVGAGLATGKGFARRAAWTLAVAGAGLTLHGAFEAYVVHPALVSADFPPVANAQLADLRGSSVFLLPAHLGAFLAATACAALGLVLAARAAPARAGAAVLLALSVAGLAVAGSFGGVLVFAGGCVVTGLLARSRRALAAAIVIGLVGGAAVAAASRVRRAPEIASESPASARVSNWKAAARLIRERPLLGWGGGSFPAGYERVRGAGSNETRHAHQQWLEEASEHGLAVVPLGIVLVATLGAGALARRRAASPAMAPLHAGLAGGAAALVAHSLVDFAWDQPTWGLPAALLAGVIAAPRLASPATRRAAVGTSVVVALASAVLVSESVVSAATSARVAASGRAAAAGAGDDAVLDPLRRATAIDPRDGSLAARHAGRLLATGDPHRLDEARREAVRAVELSPWTAAHHVVLAHASSRQGRHAEALAAADRAVELAPRDPELIALRDRIAAQGQDGVGAIRDR